MEGPRHCDSRLQRDRKNRSWPLAACEQVRLAVRCQGVGIHIGVGRKRQLLADDASWHDEPLAQPPGGADRGELLDTERRIVVAVRQPRHRFGRVRGEMREVPRPGVIAGSCPPPRTGPGCRATSRQYAFHEIRCRRSGDMDASLAHRAAPRLMNHLRREIYVQLGLACAVRPYAAKLRACLPGTAFIATHEPAFCLMLPAGAGFQSAWANRCVGVSVILEQSRSRRCRARWPRRGPSRRTRRR